MVKGQNLLAVMKQSKNGWKYRDVETVYLYYGFEKIDGKNHALFVHPKFPDLRGTVARHPGDLAIGYIQHAIKMIDEANERRSTQ